MGLGDKEKYSIYSMKRGEEIEVLLVLPKAETTPIEEFDHFQDYIDIALRSYKRRVLAAAVAPTKPPTEEE